MVRFKKLLLLWAFTGLASAAKPGVTLLCDVSEAVECLDNIMRKKRKIFICHYDQDSDSYETLCVPENTGHNGHANDYCGPCNEDPQYEISITSPNVSSGRATDIIGVVLPSPPEGSVAHILDAQGEISSVTGEFIVPLVLLTEGLNELPVSIESSGGEIIAQTVAAVTFQWPSAEASALLDPLFGVTIEVMDPGSPLVGAGIIIPPNAASRSFQVTVVTDQEHIPSLPFGEVQVGPAVTIFPHAEQFSVPVTISIPFDPTTFPVGTTVDDVILHGLYDGEWLALPATVSEGENLLLVEQLNLEVWAYLPTIIQPLSSGQVLIDSSPGYATVYIDGENRFVRTPTVLEAVSLGSHQAKIYLPGFNEVYQDFTSTSNGAVLKIDLEVQSIPSPIVQIVTPDGLAVSEAFVQIQASVTYSGSPLDTGNAIISVNQQDSFQPVLSGGNIAGFVPLTIGANVVEVRVTSPDGKTGVSAAITITRTQGGGRFLRGSKESTAWRQLQSSEVIITLSWNTDTTDIDLHVFDPSGNHAYYNNRGAIPGGLIDVDDINGFGPEIFTLSSPPPGTYRVAVDSYRIDGIPTTATLTVTVGGTLVFSGSYTFTSEDGNSSNGNPAGANPTAFWDATTFEIGDLVITKVATLTESPVTAAIFTTQSGENLITITTDAPDSIADASIRYEVTEVNENFDIDVSGTSGRVLSFAAAHNQLSAATFEAVSLPLEYEIVAFTVDGEGNRDLESEPVRIKQDLKSQVRQEYVDKKSFVSSFAIAPPARSTLIDGSQYTQGPNERFSYSEYASYSDYSGAVAVIDKSRVIANTLREAWGYPLIVTSGWRNPRRNDRLTGSAINSLHQSGDALDFNPSSSSANWPDTVDGCLEGAQITTFDQAQKALTCLAKTVFPDASYDQLFHLNHLHIEFDP